MTSIAIESGFFEASEALLELTLTQEYCEYNHLTRAIIAQWALESGYGTSELAKRFSNFGGLKYRTDLDYKKAFPIDYTDWSGENEEYFSVVHHWDYAELYLKFIQRSVYSGINLDTEEYFIKSLAEKGYVASLPNYFCDDVPREYWRRILAIMESEKFKKFLGDIGFDAEPGWL